MLKNIEFVEIDSNRVALFFTGLTDYQFENMYRAEKDMLNRAMLSKSLENREAFLINASREFVEKHGLNGITIVYVKGEHSSKKISDKTIEELFLRK